MIYTVGVVVYLASHLADGIASIINLQKGKKDFNPLIQAVWNKAKTAGVIGTELVIGGAILAAVTALGRADLSWVGKALLYGSSIQWAAATYDFILSRRS